MASRAGLNSHREEDYKLSKPRKERGMLRKDLVYRLQLLCRCGMNVLALAIFQLEVMLRCERSYFGSFTPRRRRTSRDLLGLPRRDPKRAPRILHWQIQTANVHRLG